MNMIFHARAAMMVGSALALVPAIAPAAGTVYQAGVARVEVSLIPEESPIILGQPIYLRFRVRNPTDQDLQTMQGGDYRNKLGRPENYKITVMNRQGQTLPVLDAGATWGGIRDAPRIPARETWELKLWLPDWVELTTPGEYTITCRTKLEIGQHTPGKFSGDDPTEIIDAEVQTPLRVVPRDEKRMGELIHKFAQVMLGAAHQEAGEAARRLSYMEDERVVPFLAKAADSKDYSRKFSAVAALGKFNTDEALDALTKALRTQGADIGSATTAKVASDLAQNIRHAAAVALSRSSHPGAESVLLSARADPSDAVRLTILQHFARKNTPQSLAVIRAMTNDQSERVRQEARRLLEESKQPFAETAPAT